MVARITVVGSYPKPPHEGEPFRLRKTVQAMDHGEASLVDVHAAQDDLIKEIIAEQIDAGVELVTDGQVRWDDGQTRFADGLEGFVTSGLIRYFDNNTYFRQPVVKDRVRRVGHIVLDEFLFATQHSSRPVKPVLTGPYTLAALSIDEHYGDAGALVRDLAEALNAEARDLAEAGAEAIAFDEPALARIPGSPPGDLEAFSLVAATLVEGVGAETVLQTYFGDVAVHGPGFFDMPFDVFGLDLVAGARNWETLPGFPGTKKLQAGIVDARNTRVEEAEAVAETIGRLARVVDPDRLWLSPSAGLEYLPREAAERKCRRLAEAANIWREGTR